MLWVQWRLHLSLVSIQGETSVGDITGRFAGKGKLTFWKVLEDLTLTMTKYRHFYSFKWLNDHLKQPLVPLKHFLSVTFPSHRFEECSRCKVVAFQEERGTIRGSPPPPKKSCASSSYNASPLPGNDTIQYNIGINKAPFPKDACKAQKTIQKT